MEYLDKLSTKKQSLHGMFKVIGDQMTEKDVHVLKYIYSGVASPKLLNLVNDGYSFFLCLEKLGRVTETNFRNILDLLKIITRHDLSQFVNLKKRNTVSPDIVNEYLEKKFKCDTKSKEGADCSQRLSNQHDQSPENVLEMSKQSLSNVYSTSHHSVNSLCETSHQGYLNVSHQTTLICKTENKPNVTPQVRNAEQKRRLKHFEEKMNKKCKTEIDVSSKTSCSQFDPEVTSCNTFDPQPSCSSEKDLDKTRPTTKEKATCDIRLRVRAEYCNHENALEGNIVSNKPKLLDRQFEKFTQANMILRSRDLGSIVCDIKFSDLAYLDAFWRDYINGSLLEALKSVFITDSLKQAVGNEAIKLLVNVDEDDYEAGRITLLQNLTECEDSSAA